MRYLEKKTGAMSRWVEEERAAILDEKRIVGEAVQARSREARRLEEVV